jgi:hypothetical protein
MSFSMIGIGVSGFLAAAMDIPRNRQNTARSENLLRTQYVASQYSENVRVHSNEAPESQADSIESRCKRSLASIAESTAAVAFVSRARQIEERLNRSRVQGSERLEDLQNEIAALVGDLSSLRSEIGPIHMRGQEAGTLEGLRASFDLINEIRQGIVPIESSKSLEKMTRAFSKLCELGDPTAEFCTTDLIQRSRFGDHLNCRIELARSYVQQATDWAEIVGVSESGDRKNTAIESQTLQRDEEKRDLEQRAASCSRRRDEVVSRHEEACKLLLEERSNLENQLISAAGEASQIEERTRNLVTEAPADIGDLRSTLQRLEEENSELAGRVDERGSKACDTLNFLSREIRNVYNDTLKKRTDNFNNAFVLWDLHGPKRERLKEMIQSARAQLNAQLEKYRSI